MSESKPGSPDYWPRALQWPLVKEGKVVSVSRILETLPPIFVMSDGTKIRGEMPKVAQKHTVPEPHKRRTRIQKSQKSKKSKSKKSKKSKSEKSKRSSTKRGLKSSRYV